MYITSGSACDTDQLTCACTQLGCTCTYIHKYISTSTWKKVCAEQYMYVCIYVVCMHVCMGPSPCNLDWHYVITQYKRGARMDGLLGARMDGQWVV